MTVNNKSMTDLRELNQKRAPSLTTEFVHFLVHNKKWWLAPIVLALGIVGLFAVLAGTGAAPFIYTLF